MRRGDVIHLGLMLAALGVAYLIPFELVLLAYAVLGPAHYFTEISWLHDRSYYLPHKGLGVALALTALGAMFLASPYWYGVVVWGAFVACATLAAQGTRARMAIGGAGLALTALLAALQTPFTVLAVLLPTLIHVSLFTLVFMLLGAVRTRSPAQFGLVAAYVAAVTLIVTAPPTAGWAYPPLASHAQSSFGDIPGAIGKVLGLPELTLDARLMGLLSFVYTYHYLNWFIKAEVIRWNRAPRGRLIAVAALSVAATTFYFVNFELGFTVLLLISLMHVLLEFPLNSLSIRELAGALAGPAPAAEPLAAPASRRALARSTRSR
ncbi:MAG TPA: hypothetical protein VMT68_13470 [Caulobacteraceae bacterium]|nr:hypothetical protein [Caulobacteraceae bacterium]